MKRCPQCNRAYSDFIQICPQCNISLTGDTGASSVQQNYSQNSNNNMYNQQVNQQTQYSYSPNNNMYNQQVNQQTQNNYSQPANNRNTGYSAQGNTVQASKSSMGFGEAIASCFKKYAVFSGRARRSEYWWFMLFINIVSFVLAFVSVFSEVLGIVYGLWTFAVFLPNLAVYIRRLHDVGKDWKYIFWSLVPIYGIIKLLMALVQDSDPGANAYGPCPK